MIKEKPKASTQRMGFHLFLDCFIDLTFAANIHDQKSKTSRALDIGTQNY